MKKSRLMLVAAAVAGVVLITTTAAHAGDNSDYVFTKAEVNGIPAGQGAFFHKGDKFWVEDTARDGHSAVLDLDAYYPAGGSADWQVWSTGASVTRSSGPLTFPRDRR